MACPKCGGEVEQNGRGRPAVYCSPVCRKAAEYELRRVQRALSSAEDQVQWRRVRLDEIAAGAGFGEPKRLAVEVESWLGEVARLEDRLRVLLAAGG